MFAIKKLSLQVFMDHDMIDSWSFVRKASGPVHPLKSPSDVSISRAVRKSKPETIVGDLEIWNPDRSSDITFFFFEGPFELSMRQSRFRARCACNYVFLFSMLRPCVVCQIFPATGKLSAV